MSLFSSKKTPAEKTIALFDIENGSIAVALASVSPDAQPRVFAEKRIPFPVSYTVHGDVLLERLARAVEEGATHISEVAARIRMHPALHASGVIQKSTFFLGAPWSEVTPGEHGLQASAPRVLTNLLKNTTNTRLGAVPTSFHMFGTAAARTLSPFYPNEVSVLCIISGEMTELILISEATVVGQATFPVGSHTVLRTCMSHAGISLEEARSAFTFLPPYLSEVVTVAQEHFLEQLYTALHPLAAQFQLQKLFVLANEPFGEWFAQSIAGSTHIASMFAGGGVVRALRATQFAPLVGTHAPKPDLFVLLETLFVADIHRV